MKKQKTKWSYFHSRAKQEEIEIVLEAVKILNSKAPWALITISSFIRKVVMDKAKEIIKGES